ncbi:MAG TPA: hypothetical protein PK566_15360 [Pseudobacteroides sp.]|nr:hypothetical protein [Pseudobacteroides sp.]
MRINKDKSVGRVLFIVEGARTEFTLLRRIFCDVLSYEYIEKRRNNARFFKNRNISTSKIAVINTENSNISDICDENCYLDNVFETLISEYDFPVDKAAIYYIFDRDPKSNVNTKLIRKLISQLKNAYENEGGLRGGLLLLSYPCIESYVVSNFIDDTHLIEFAIGEEVKAFVAQKNTEIQYNKITEDTVKKAASEMMKYLDMEQIILEIDNMGHTNSKIFERQELKYSKSKTYKLVSLLSVALIDLGIIELDDI